MKYIGNKTRLLDFIYESMLNFGVPMNGVFCDAFGGTGSVGRFFKEKGYRIISNDFMTYSYIQQYVVVTMNKMPDFHKVSENGIEEVLEHLNNLPLKKGYVYDNYAPSGKYGRQYFSDVNAMKIDAVRDEIEQWYYYGNLSEGEYFILVNSLVNAADFVANISGTYGAYLKIWRSMALKPLMLMKPSIYDNNKQNEIYKKDANSLVREVVSDILYLDPPYNSRQYSSNFHVLESLSVWDKTELVGKTGQRKSSSNKSLYCLKREAPKAFEDLIASAKTKYIALSYNNEGIISKEELLKILSTRGRVKEYTTDYRRFRTERDGEHRRYKQCGDKVKEHLFIVKTE